MIRPLILSGGGGTRLWPLSTRKFPKQFHNIIGDESMLQSTALRCSDDRFHRPLVATAEEYGFVVVDQLRQIGLAPEAVLLEPEPRNTAPALAAAAHWALAQGDDHAMLVMPSDHFVADKNPSIDAVFAALQAAEAGKLLTFGIPPTAANTGYGYIQACSPDGPVREVVRFVEKPSAEVAAEFVAEGSYYWNSGIFLFRPSAYLRELERYSPAVAKHVEMAMHEATTDGLFVRPEARAFADSPNISVDYAVMEHSSEVLVVPVAFAWSDVGSWDAIHELLPADEHGNAITGDVLAVDVSNSIIRNEADFTVGVLGFDGILCVVTRDAAVVAPLSRAQDVKRLSDDVRARGDECGHRSAQVFQRWGSYQVLNRAESFETKHIIINPRAKLPLQEQSYASAHWIVVKGSAKVTVGDRELLLEQNDSTFIPAGTVHGLINLRQVPLHLIEVRCGSDSTDGDEVRWENN